MTVNSGDNFFPYVSIVIAAYNCENSLPLTLDSIKKLKYPNKKIEIIIIDDASVDNTANIAKSYNIKVISHNKRLGVAGARNTGIQNSINEFIAFIDADCIVSENWLKNLIKPFRDTSVWATGGYILNYKNEKTNIHKFINFDLMYRKRNNITKSVPGGNSAFRKITFNKLGLLDEKFEGAEDIEISIRILKSGHKLVFVDSAIVYHPFPSSIPNYFLKNMNYAKNRTQLYLNKNYFNFKDDHTPNIIIVQPFILFLIIFNLILYNYNIILYTQYIAIFLFFILILLNINFLILVYKHNFNLLLFTFLMIIIKNFSLLIGIILGSIHYIKKR